MSKYSIPDDYEWADEKKPETDDGRALIDIRDHTVRIDDNRESTGYQYGVEWLFAIESGTIVGWYRGHYLKGRTQSDPMNSPPWSDIPFKIKRAIAEEMDTTVGELEVDEPEFYGDGGES